jgi:lysophospholipase L1-like esterase
MKAVLQNVGVSLVATLIALAGIEICLRIWGPEVLTLGNPYVFYQYDPVLGWANRPNAQGWLSRGEFRIAVSNNSEGMRDAEVGDKRPGEFRVAFLGDSYTWGMGAAYGERFTEVIERQDPRIRTLNFGVSGFSPVQYLFQLDRVFPLKPDYVILVFCLGNDLTDNVEYVPYNHPKPYAKLSSDGSRVEIAGYPLPDTSRHGPALFGAASSLRIVGLIKLAINTLDKKHGGEILSEPSLLYGWPEWLTPTQRQTVATLFKINELLLDAIRKRIDQAIGPNRFAVVLAPSKSEYLPPAPWWNPNGAGDGVLDSLRRLGIPAIDGRPALTPADFWDEDAHWRPSGNRKIGELIEKYLASVHPR